MMVEEGDDYNCSVQQAKLLLPILYGKLNGLYDSNIQVNEVADAARELASCATQKQLNIPSIVIWESCFAKADNTNENCISLFYAIHDMITKRLRSPYVEEQFLQLDYTYSFLPSVARQLASLRSRRLYLGIDKINRCLSLWKEKGVLEVPVTHLLDRSLKGTDEERARACDDLANLCLQERESHFQLNAKHVALQQYYRFSREQEDSLGMKRSLEQELQWMRHLADLCPMLCFPLSNQSLPEKPKTKMKYFMAEEDNVEEAYNNLILSDYDRFKTLLEEAVALKDYKDSSSIEDQTYQETMVKQTDHLYNVVIQLASRQQHLVKATNRTDNRTANLEAINKKLMESRMNVSSKGTTVINILDQRVEELVYRLFIMHKLQNAYSD